MSNNIIIELSNKIATSQLSTSDFECTFNPIIINEGDEITIKNCFIDTIQQTYDQIFIEQDINFTITFAFYEIDLPLNNAQGASDKIYSQAHGAAPTYDMYLCFYQPQGSQDWYLYSTQVQGTIKRGLYTPTSLAIEITRQLAVLPSPQSGAIGLPYTNFVLPNDSNSRWVNLVIVADPTVQELDYTNYYTYRLGTNYQTGARQVSMIYNDQGDNKFQFQYLHTPFYDADANEVVGYSVDMAKVFTRDSGVVLLSLEPRDFWQNLGFNVDDMTMKINLNIPEPQPVYFDNAKCTTENLFTIDDLFQSSGRKMPAPTQVSFLKESTHTRGIYADQFYSFKNLTPCYLVELLSPYTSLYLSGNSRNKFINAIVSRAYTQNNFITGFSDSGITYVHQGVPFILSSVRARILNPDTKETATDIGSSNYFILNILKK
jgi:hypothetical protein